MSTQTIDTMTRDRCRTTCDQAVQVLVPSNNADAEGKNNTMMCPCYLLLIPEDIPSSKRTLQGIWLAAIFFDYVISNNRKTTK